MAAVIHAGVTSSHRLGMRDGRNPARSTGRRYRSLGAR
jgi:hypothetical protein